MDHNITPKVHEMWHVLQPLFAHGTPHDPAWNDLNRVWREATRIGILMLSKPCIYRWTFLPWVPIPISIQAIGATAMRISRRILKLLAA